MSMTSRTGKGDSLSFIVWSNFLKVYFKLKAYIKLLNISIIK